MLDISFTPTKESEKTAKVVKEWKDRARGMMRQVAFRSARSIHRGVLRRLPDEARGLKKSLKLLRVSGLGKKGFGYAVMSTAQPREVEAVIPDVEILYVVTKKIAARTPPEIQTLVNFSPWTTDTIPFWPQAKYARVVTRGVTQGTVRQISDDRKRDKVTWQKELDRAGVRPKRIKLRPSQKVIPDVAFESLRYEFGIGAQPAPHWRPAVLGLIKGQGLRRIAKNVTPMLTDAGNKAWSEDPSANTVGATKAKQLEPFQKTLGIRVK